MVRAVRAPGGGSRPQPIDKLTELAKEHGAKGMAYVYVEEGRALRGPIVKFLGEAEQAALVAVSAGNPATSLSSPPTRRPSPPRCSGAVPRAHRPARRGARERWSLLWVDEFPLFEMDEETSQLTYGHNPFSLITAEQLPLLESDPLALRGAQYDLVLNGVELGSGCLRNHDAAVQRAVLRVLGMSDERIDGAFGWFLRGPRVRRPAARRHRPRLRPHHHAAGRRRLYPRRHRLPQDVVRRRPHDGCAERRRGRRATQGAPASGSADRCHGSRAVRSRRRVPKTTFRAPAAPQAFCRAAD